MRVLITGATGFVGRHLSAYILSKKDVQVYGLIRPTHQKRGSNSGLMSGVRPVKADLLSERSMLSALQKVRPDRIYHLAGQSSVKDSWEKPKKTLHVNVNGTRALLEAAVRAGSHARILVCASADEYGASGKKHFKLTEEATLAPISPYGVSKLAQDVMGLHYHRAHGLSIVRTRAFNHIGPGQDPRFVVPSFARQFADIAAGKQKPEIKVGNLDAVRDFTDVRDVVRAYWLAVEKGKAGEVYNVASGRPRKVAEVLRFYLSLSSVKIKVLRGKAGLRASDLPRLVGDSRKIHRDTGWKPRIRFETTLRDVLRDFQGNRNG